jgi:phosphohistidine phosphatase
MRRLILLRHAKSDWSAANVPDRNRGLAPRGCESAPKVGCYMARHGLVPDLVMCSAAARARQTWELVARAFADPPAVSCEERLYDAGAETVLDVIKATSRNVHILLVVGHNPGLRDLAELLIAAGDVNVRQRLLEKFPTSSLAVIDFPVDNWARLHPKSGRLDRFVAARTLETATD